MSLKIAPLGGMGEVTQNLFVYELENELMIIDCGIGFPDHTMPGVDILIPDISYLVRQMDAGKELVGIVFTHGHDDHIAALPYLTEFIPEVPMYGSPLTAAFASARLKDGGSNRSVRAIQPGERVSVGSAFEIEFVPVTHSVPDTQHVVVRTSEGVIYHGSDFKFDDAPVDGRVSAYDRISEIGAEGVLCTLSDCLRVEDLDAVPSESTVGPVIERLMQQAKGVCLVTLMSSHIHRIQQTVDAAHKLGRKVAFVGRSVEQNVATATSLGFLKLPEGVVVDKKHTRDVRDDKLVIIIAGSQGQEGSSLTRAVFGEHRQIQIRPDDMVIFSASPIPGNEVNYYGAIDELSRNGVAVYYPDIEPGLHQSGHAAVPAQQKLAKLTKPKYLWPIGGADRHRRLYQTRVADAIGVNANAVLMPDSGEILEFSKGAVKVAQRIALNPQAVDGLGVGDVGPRVLGDRRQLSEAGMVVIIVPEGKSEFMFDQIKVVSHGFVFMREADEVVEFIKSTTEEVLKSNKNQKRGELVRAVEKQVARKLYRTIEREPLVKVVFV